MIEFFDALPDGELLATEPGGHSDSTGLGSTMTLNSAFFRARVASASGAHFTPGTGTSWPKASLSLGLVKLTTGLPTMRSRRVCWTAVFTTLWLNFLPLGLSGSAMSPAMATCLVIAMRAAVRSPSVVPVLPAIGYLLPTMFLVPPAVEPWHSPKNDWSPTGQRAASVAARATSGSTAWWQRGLAASSLVPLKSRISSTGSGSQ